MASITTTNSTPKHKTKSMIVVDCGSSGSRVYRVGRNDNGNLFCTKLEKMAKIDDILPLGKSDDYPDEEYEQFIEKLEKLSNVNDQIVDGAMNGLHKAQDSGRITEEDVQRFVDSITDLKNSMPSFVNQIYIGASAGLRKAKETNKVTDEDIQRFRGRLPNECKFSELPDTREAELEFVVAHCLVRECYPFFCSTQIATGAGLGMISMGGKSMQFVNTTETGSIVCNSMLFAAHTATDMVCGKPFTRSPYPEAITGLVAKKNIELCKATINTEIEKFDTFQPMKGLILGITGFAKAAAFCGLEARPVSKEIALKACDDQINMLYKCYNKFSYEKGFSTKEKKRIFPFRSTLGALAKTAVFRHVLDKTMSADAGTRLFCCRKWKQIGASQRFSGSNYETVVEDIETEWSLGYFVERENDENETNKSLSTVFETLRTSSKSKSGFKSLSGKN